MGLHRDRLPDLQPRRRLGRGHRGAGESGRATTPATRLDAECSDGPTGTATHVVAGNPPDISARDKVRRAVPKSPTAGIRAVDSRIRREDAPRMRRSTARSTGRAAAPLTAFL